MPFGSDGRFRLDRRRLLQGAAGATALLAGATLARNLGLFQHTARVHLLSVARYDDALVARIARAIQGFPSMAERVPGSRVLLKPNLVEYSPERPINTDPQLVVAAILAFRGLGAREVIVADGPGHRRDTERVLEGSGLGEALREVDAPFVDLNVDDVVETPLLDPRSRLASLPIASTVLGADLVVSMPKLKTHHWAGVTLSMKNLFGVVPGTAVGWPKNPLHWGGIPQVITDLWRVVQPGFAIVDGLVGMEGDGPIMGTARPVGVVALGDHLPAVDATCARLMGFRASELAFLQEARSGGGTIARTRIRVTGDGVNRVEFRRGG